MRRPVLMAGTCLAMSLASACSKGPESKPDREFPLPIIVYDDSGESAAPSPAATTPVMVAGPQAQFECVAGAADATADLKSESADRTDDAGRPVKASVYDPAGAQVFGIAVTVLEKFQDADGRAGIAAYVASKPADVLRAIQTRFPNSAAKEGTTVTGPGLAGTITVGEAQLGSGTLTRIECAPPR